MAFPQAASPPVVKGQFQVFVRGFPAGYWTNAKVPRGKPKKTSVQPAGTAAPQHFPSGLVEFDELELKGFLGTDGGFNAAITKWLGECANARTGRASVSPQAAKRDVTVVQYDTDGREIHEWLCVGAFITDPGNVDLESGDEKKVEAELKLSVDRVDPIR